MKVNTTHHDAAKKAFADGAKTKAVQALLMSGKKGLTKAQASSACRTARKQLGLYKKGSGKAQGSDADKQAEMKTEISQD